MKSRGRGKANDGSMDVDEPLPFGGGDGSAMLRRLSSSGSSLRLERKSSSKLSIRPFSDKPALPPDFEGQMWIKLEAAIDAVHKAKSVQYPQEELYRAVQDLCLNNFDATLYKKLEEKCDKHIRSQVDALSCSNTSGNQFLELVGRVWDTLCCEMTTIKTIFSCLDRSVLVQSCGNKKPLWDMGLELFYAHLKAKQETFSKIISSILGEVRKERDGLACDRTVLRKLTGMLFSLHLYAAMEGPLLQATKQFYIEEANASLQFEPLKGVKEYLHLIERRLKEESERVEAYLSLQTKKQLITLVEVHLIAEHVDDMMLSSGFAQLMDGRCVPELNLLFKHLSLPNVQKLASLRTALKAYVKQEGTKRVMNEASDATMIPDLLAMKKSLDQLVQASFENRKEFVYILRDGFETFLNLRSNKPAELLAKFIDGKMKLGAKETDEELELLLDACLDLFRLIPAKDVFEAFYFKDFAKRLLLGRCASPDVEKGFISKLKTEWGSNFTLKLEGMMKDIDVSKEIAAEYKSPPDVPQLTVQVLTENYWPTYQSCEVRLPKQLSTSLDHFKTSYLEKNKGRKLVWQSCLCTCTIKATCAKWKKELMVSLLQGLVLLLFNSEKEITFGRTKELVGTDDGELVRAVQAMLFSQARILKRKTKGGRDLQDTDVLMVNEDFTSRHFRVKINGTQMKETDDEIKKTNEKISKDRVSATDACIVRTMKTKKTLTHSDLMSCCLVQLKFPLQPSEVKKRIEYLIEREYLRRDDEKQNVYHYIA